MENNSSASERWLLRGAPNARDLGGLPTMDGRTIRPGLLLRSGELAGITEPDAQTLTEYPLRTVVDFRTDLEREQKPDRVLPGVQYVHCPIVQQAAAGLTREEHADPYAAVVAHAKAMAGRERAFMCDCTAVSSRRHSPSRTTGSFLRFCSRRRTARCSTTARRGKTASVSARCCC